MIPAEIEASTRKGPLMSRLPRFPKDGPPEFASKLDGWFVDLACVFRDGVKPQHSVPADLGSRGRPPVVALPEWPRTVGEMHGLISRLPDSRIAKAMSVIQAQTPQEVLNLNLNDGLLNMLSLLKYQVTLAELQWREKQGEREASNQLVDVMDLCNRWLHEQLPPGGVRFKTNGMHNLLMLYGLAAGFEKLTSSELVQFFDEMCPCGKIHNQQVLQRLRVKLQKRLARGAELQIPE